jgi:hypothetical protein
MTPAEWTALAEDFRSGHIDPEDWETVAMDRYPGGVEWPRDAYFWPWALFSIAEACVPEGFRWGVTNIRYSDRPGSFSSYLIFDRSKSAIEGDGATAAHALMAAICLYRAKMEERK